MILREGLGFRRLSLIEQPAYRVMLNAFSSMKKSFDVSKINRDVDLLKVMLIVIGDNPSVIYFDNSIIHTVDSGNDKKVELAGVIPKFLVNKMQSELDNKTNQIISSFKEYANDEYIMLLKLYEYIQSNIQYDIKELNAIENGISKNPDSHNAYGALINGLAVCDGFSSAFSLLAQKLGFECMLVVGDSVYCSTNNVKHVWNIIKVGNMYYHLDVTWDTRRFNEYDEFAYDYFLVTDNDISADHNWNKKVTPVCSHNDLSYYIKNSLFADNILQFNNLCKESRKLKNNLIRVKLSKNINLTENSSDRLAQIYLNEITKPGMRNEIIYGWNEYTRCFFGKKVN